MTRGGLKQLFEHGALTLVTAVVVAMLARWGLDQQHALLAIASIAVAALAIALAVGARVALRRVIPPTYRWDDTDRRGVGLLLLALASVLAICAAGVVAATMPWDRPPLITVERIAAMATLVLVLSIASLARLMHRRRQMIDRARAERAALGSRVGD